MWVPYGLVAQFVAATPHPDDNNEWLCGEEREAGWRNEREGK
jgi:hypothetical protein